MQLTAWIPALATTLGLPPVVVHLHAQRTAADLGITWGMDIPAADVERIRDAVTAKFAKRTR